MGISYFPIEVTNVIKFHQLSTYKTIGVFTLNASPSPKVSYFNNYDIFS